MFVQLFANQKGVRVIKSPSNNFGMMDVEATHKAMGVLKPTAFKLWAYLNLNREGHEIGLSSKHFCAVSGCSRNAYFAAVQELIDRGYLVEVELYEGLQGYLFIEGGH